MNTILHSPSFLDMLIFKCRGAANDVVKSKTTKPQYRSFTEFIEKIKKDISDAASPPPHLSYTLSQLQLEIQQRKKRCRTHNKRCELEAISQILTEVQNLL